MKKHAFMVVLAILVAIPLAASAESPRTVQVFVGFDVWEVDNPCTEEYIENEITIESTSTLGEIIIDGVGRFTQVSYDINLSDPWVGKGTDTGVELFEPFESGNVSSRWMATNTENGQKIRWAIWGHQFGDPETGEWVVLMDSLECIKS